MNNNSEHPQKPQVRFRRFRRTLLLLGLLFVVGTPLLIEFRFRRPIGEGPAGPPVPAEPFQTVWTTRQLQVVGLGDSITRGLGANSRSHTFFQRLLDNPDDEYADMRGKCLSVVLPNHDAINLAVSGSTSIDHERVIREELPSYDEEVFGLVVMTSGGNDLIHPYGRRPPSEAAMYGATLAQAEPWIKNFEERLLGNLREIQDKFAGGCMIFLADIYDPTDGVGDAPSIFLPPWPDGLAIHARYNETIRRVAGTMEHVHIVPLYEHFLGHGSHCRQFWRSTYDRDDPTYWFFTNIEDPNDRGYDAIRRVFLNEIVKQRTGIGVTRLSSGMRVSRWWTRLALVVKRGSVER
ncbi:MAG: SGNH/GDSL hydrolase family protein [Planctomycetota bacterium]